MEHHFLTQEFLKEDRDRLVQDAVHAGQRPEAVGTLTEERIEELDQAARQPCLLGQAVVELLADSRPDPPASRGCRDRLWGDVDRNHQVGAERTADADRNRIDQAAVDEEPISRADRVEDSGNGG